MKFTQQEKQLIINSVLFRKTVEANNEKCSRAIDSIILYVKHPFAKLTSFEKVYLKGCIKDYSIYPYEDLFKLTDYEVFQASIDFHPKFELVDTGLSLLKKMNDKYYSSYRLFQSVLIIAKQFSAIKTVFYSLSGKEIYKVGIVLHGEKGFKIEFSNTSFSRFEVVDLIRSQFMFEGTPIEILRLIKILESEGKLNVNHTILAAILKNAVN